MRIEFTQKQLQSLTRYKIDHDEESLDNLERQKIKDAWDQNQGNFDAFLLALKELSDINLWKSKRIDLAFWHEPLNIIDDALSSILKENINQNETILIILRFLKNMLQYASNINFFSSVDRLIEIYGRYSDDLNVISEVLGIFISISSKINDKKSTIENNYKGGLETFDKDIKQLMKESIMGLIYNFEQITFLLLQIGPNQNEISEDIKQSLRKSIETNKPEEYGDRKSQYDALVIFQNIIHDQRTLEEVYVIILKALNLYLNVGDLEMTRDKRSQQVRLEQLFPPKQTIERLIKLQQNTNIGKKVHIQVVNILFLFVILDLNSLFNLEEPTDNQYYQEACNYHDFYILTIQSLAYHHAYQKLQDMTSSFMTDDLKLQQFIQEQKTLVSEEILQDEQLDNQMNQVPVQRQRSESINPFQINETIKSQKYMNQFVNLVLNLLNIKNRTLQNQLYPQFLKPLLAIVSVQPIGHIYPININCQVKAAKLLKDVVKLSTIDDPGAVERVIERTKQEIYALNATHISWTVPEDDDTENNITQVYRQDFIRTLLRFLSYSIIRNDPNAINFQQNFVSNSRKILESNLIQEDIMNNIFNVQDLNDIKHVNQNIDPVALQCLQLVSYVFNDLPSKIPQYEDLIKNILKYLNEHIPIQADVFIIILKFFQTLCLQEVSMKLLITSEIFNKFTDLCLDKRAYKHIVSQMKAMQYKELLQQIALSNPDISKIICKSIIEKFSDVIKMAWDTTLNYIQMEEKCREDKSLSEDEKNRLKQLYEKDQLALENCCEMVSHVLWYYAIDEQVYRDDNLIREALVHYKSEILEIFRRVICTPIISSGCPNMFPIFTEVMRQLLAIYGEDTVTQFMAQVIKDLNIQVENVYIACGTTNLDDIDDLIGLKSNPNMILDEKLQIQGEGLQNQQEMEFLERNKELAKKLSGEDQLSVVFAKISFYCNLTKLCYGPVKQRLINDHQLCEVMIKLYKVQSLVNRFHASKYSRDMITSKKQLEQLKVKYQDLIPTYDWKNHKVNLEAKDEEELFKNLYYNFEYALITDITDLNARKNEKTIVELQLDENLSHTSNLCQTAIRKLIQSILRLMNKKKQHFSERVDIRVLEFNREIGKQIADQFNNDFSLIMEVGQDDYANIMKYCCEYSAVFGEFTKLLFQNMAHGSLLLSFVHNGGINIVKQLILFLAEYQYKLQKQNKPFPLVLCRSLQLLWSHLVDFFVQLIEAKYLDLQFTQFLISFKTNPTQKIQTTDNQKEYDLAIKRMQKYFMGLFGESLHFLFVELNENKFINELLPNRRLNVFEYFDLSSELFFFSFIEIYQYVSEGLTHIKIFNENHLQQIKTANDPTIPKVSPYDANKQTLLEMGFPEDQSLAALEETANDIEFAIELLSNNVPLQVKQKSEKKEDAKDEDPLVFEKFDEYNTYGTFNQSDLYYIIVKTLKDYLKFVPQGDELLKKQAVIENIFYHIGKKHDDKLVRDMLESCTKQILELLTDFHQEKNFRQIGYMAYSVAVLLSYRRGDLLKHKSAFQAIFELIDLSQLTIKELQVQIQKTDKDFTAKLVVNLIKQLDQVMSLFLYISEEAKISSDLTKLDHLVKPQTGFVNSIEEVQAQIEKIQSLNENNMFSMNKEQSSEIFKKVTILSIDLFKNLQNMDIKAIQLDGYCLQNFLKKCLENLNFLLNIKGYGDFDCQSCFLKNEGLKALFGIKFLQNGTPAQKTYQMFDQKLFNDIQLQSKILLQQLSQNDALQVKVYENLIKSALFINFQEKYKQQEGQDIKTLFNFEELKQQQPKIQQTQSKKKKSSTPVKFQGQSQLNQQNEDRNINTGQKVNSSKSLKQQIFKKAEYCEVTLEEFINFFSNVMQIQDLKSFLQACQNVCIIKKKQVDEKTQVVEQKLRFEEDKKPEDRDKKEDKPQLTADEKLEEHHLRRSKRLHKNKEEQEKKQQDEEQKPVYQNYITLTNNQLKEMVLQYGQQLQHQTGVQLGLQFETEKQQQAKNIQNFQEQIVFTFLDLFIDQIRDDKMIIQQQCKQSNMQMGFEISQTEKSIKIKDSESKIKSQRYFFDILSILSHLTYIMTHSPILVQSLLKHKEQKTYKFIIRNIYYLMVLQIDKDSAPVNVEESDQLNSYTISINDSQLNAKKTEVIVEFFKRVMLDNPHLTNQEKRLKHEARGIFIKEVLKNLQEGQYNKQYPQWPVLGVIYNVGAVWLIQAILKEEDKEEQSKEKSFEQLVQNMQKYRNQIRVNMIKQLIHEIQHQHQHHNQSKNQQQQLHDQQNQSSMSLANHFQLIKQIQRVQSEIVSGLNQLTNGKDQIQLCLSAISCILKPFDSNKSTWGEKDADKNSLLNESNLGFVGGQSTNSLANRGDRDQEMIEEQENEDEEDEDDDEEEDEEDDDDSSSSEDNDDDLLDSERSQRNFRFSEAEEFDDEYGDQGIDIDDDDDDDDDDEEGELELQISGDVSGSMEDGGPAPIFDNIGDYGDEDDFMDEDGSSESFGGPARLSQSNQRAGSPNQQQNQDQARGQDEDDQGDDDEFEDGEDIEDASQEDDYDDEDEGTDQFYDDELEDDDNQIEIYIGRGANNQDRLSNADFGQRLGGLQRRDDVLSMNNMSIDMFNMQHLGQGGDRLDAIREEQSESMNFSEDDFNDQNGAGQHIAQQELGALVGAGGRIQQRIPQIQSGENLGNVINSIVGMLLGNRRGRSGQSFQQSIQNLIEEKLNQNTVIHSPLETLQTIYDLIREVQEMPELYQQYIKEHEAQHLSNQINQQSKQFSEDLNHNTQQEEKKSDDILIRTGAQQSLAPSTSRSNQYQSRNQSAQQQGVQIITTSLNRQNLGGLEEELDPEFLESLDDTGLQNLADTQDVMNRIFNQTHQFDHQKTVTNTLQLLETITNQDQRNEIFRNMPEDVFNQLPPRLFNEGLSQRAPSRNQQHAQAQRAQLQQAQSQAQDPLQQQEQPNQVGVQGQQVAIPINNLRPADFLAPVAAGRRRNRPTPARERLMSLDSQLNDMVDFSRGANDPYFKNPSVQALKSDMPINANLIFNSFLNYLKDLIAEMSSSPIYDSKGNDINKQSEQVVHNSLALQQDNLEQSYQKVQGMIDMIMVWIQLLTNGQFFMVREQNLMRLLFRVTLIRQGVFIRLYQWIHDGVEAFSNHVRDLSSQTHQIVSLKQDNKGFKVERGYGMPGRIEVIDFVLHSLRCIKQLAQECNKISTNASLDLIKYPSSDAIMSYLIGSSKEQNIDKNKQLIEQIFEQVVMFVRLVEERPDLVNQQSYMIEGKEVWMEDIISTLVNIFQQLAQAAEKYHSLNKQQALPENLKNIKFGISEQLINYIGELLLTKEFKSKDLQKQIKGIFSDINKINEGSQSVQRFFKQSLSNSLLRIIEIINAKNSHIRIDNEKLNKEVIILSQILKIAKSNKKQEVNICDEELFFRIVKEISDFIDKKQDSKSSSTSSQLSFVFKDEFRTIMIALFIVFEYNLKFIFLETQEDKIQYANNQSNNRRRNQNAAQQRRQGGQQVQNQALDAAAINIQDQQEPIQNADQIQAQVANPINVPQIIAPVAGQLGNNPNQVKTSQDVVMEEIAMSQDKNVSKEKPDLMTQIDEHLKLKIKDEKAREDKRLRIFIKFCLQHKKIINSFIRANQQVLNDSLRNVIMKVPQLLDFDNKRLLFRSQIKKIQRKYRLKYIDLNVRRDKVFDDSYEQLRNINAERYRGQLNVEFADEQGIDEGGLTKEWFILLSQQIFNADLALFLQSNAGSTYYPNPKSNIQPDFQSLFRFVGRIVGKAIYEQQLLDCYFVKALYKLMLGLPLNYHDVEDFDDQLYNNLKWCLSNSVDNLGITFTETIEYFGKNEEIEIIPNGAKTDVTDENKIEYVKQMAYHKLYGSIKNQVDSFLQGFYDVIPRNLIQIFDNRELELLISGLPTIDIADLRENTIYTNYSAESSVVKWLFEALEEFDNSERAEFIQFVTGSSKVPVEGFKGLRGSRGFQKFQIVKYFTNDTNRLPQAHTCFKQLELPEYTTKEQLKDRLYTAIKEGKTFGFA